MICPRVKLRFAFCVERSSMSTAIFGVGVESARPTVGNDAQIKYV